MRKLSLIILLFLTFNDHTGEPVKHQELLDLINFTTEEGLFLEQWQVTIQEKQTHKDINKLRKQIGRTSKLSKQENKHIKKYSTPKIAYNEQMNVTIQLTVPHQTQYSPKITLIIAGNTWDEVVSEKYTRVLNEFFELYFSEKADIYTCLMTTSNGIIEDVHFTYLLKKKLMMKNIVVQSDTIADSTYDQIIYGYVPSWDNDLNVLGQRLNMQIVLQTEDPLKTNLIIGTPILINEY